MAVVHIVQFTDRVAVWGSVMTPEDEPVEPTEPKEMQTTDCALN